jgi:hypothetical protein
MTNLVLNLQGSVGGQMGRRPPVRFLYLLSETLQLRLGGHGSPQRSTSDQQRPHGIIMDNRQIRMGKSEQGRQPMSWRELA